MKQKRSRIFIEAEIEAEYFNEAKIEAKYFNEAEMKKSKPCLTCSKPTIKWHARNRNKSRYE
jgi:hypothetical protein